MKALVLGGTGFLGKHLVEQLGEKWEVVSIGSKEVDLMDFQETMGLFKNIKPDVIFHLAAYVGGIGLNKEKPGEMFYYNMQMGINVVEAFRRLNVVHKSKLVVVGTVCMYPKYTPTPFEEDFIWNGYPEETNAPYGVAKKSLMVMCDAYANEYGLDITFSIPSNLYGPEDNFNLDTSHVIPAIMRKCHEAKVNRKHQIILWGDGSPTREFLYAKDCVKALEFLAIKDCGLGPFNIASNNSIKIKDLAYKIIELTAFAGKIEWDTSKPNGQPKRAVSNSKLLQLGYEEKFTSLDDGLRETYEWYRRNFRYV